MSIAPLATPFILIKILKLHPSLVWLAILLPIFLSGLLLFYLDKRTMTFEFNADKRGAKLIGVDDMINGIEEIQSERSDDAQENYDRKLAKLEKLK